MANHFGDRIRELRIKQQLLLRQVASKLEVDTSIISKVERGERPSLTDYLKPLAEILKLDLKEVQSKFIADKINKDFGDLEHLTEGLKAAEKQVKKRRK